MSTTIDQRVVEMQFDNRHFESNVATTMSTLDKLKQSLNLTGATKGLENVGTAAKGINVAGLGTAVETVQAKFSALGVMGVTALSNITNSAVNAGKRIVSALTIDPIKSGFSEYETKMGAIQTIMSNTASKGTTMADVTRVINELNTYADKTIYNFAEMTRNIGTFTAAGVGLEESASAIQGIANLAAASGSTSQQASTAMYQLSQALAAGTVKLMDWNSVVNAGMGGEKFQEALKATARDHGVAVDQMIKDNGSFRESLQEGWITADILNETLSKFTVEGAKEYSKAMMESGKWTQEQADALIKEAQSMEDAATKVKTFTQLWDTLKESAQSGWGQTWEIIVGDFEEAKETLTEISEVIGGMIGNSAESRNNLLSGALTTGWKQLLNEGIEDAAGFEEMVTNVAKEHGVKLDEMIDDETTFQDTLKEGWLTGDMLTESVTKYTDKLSKMSDEELEAAGYTKETVDKMKELCEQVKNGSISMDEFAKKMARPSGRELLIESLWNAFKGILSVVEPVKQAFRDIFPKMESEQLYNLLVSLQEFTSKLKLSETASDNLRRTFRGLFAVLDIVKQAFSAVFKVIAPLFGKVDDLGGGILEVTARWGDWLVKLNETIKRTDFFNNVVQKVVGFVKMVADAVKKMAGAFKEAFVIPGLEAFNALLDRVRDRMGQVGDTAGKMKSWVVVAIEAMGSALEKCDFFEMMKGLWDGVKKLGVGIAKAFGELTKGFIDIVGGSNFDGLFDFINTLSFSAIAAFFAKFVKGFSDITDSVGDFKSSALDILDGVKDTFKAYQSQLKAEALKKIAVAIAILAASILVLSFIDSEKLSASLGAITVLFADLMASMALFNKFGGTTKGLVKTVVAMQGMAVAVLIMAFALRTLGSLDSDELAKGLIGVIGLTATIVAAAKMLSSEKKNVIKGATQMVIFAAAIKVLASVCKDLSTLSWEGLAKGLIGVGVLMGAVALFMKYAKFNGKAMTTATGIVILAAAIKILASACNDFGQMSWESIGKGLTGIGVLLLEVAAFTRLTGNAKHIISTGIALVAIGAAMKIFASAVSDFGSMKWESIAKGLVAMGVALAAVTVAVNFMPKNMMVVGTGLVIVASALVILSEALTRMGGMMWEEIARGLVTLGISMAILAVGLNAMTGTLAGSAAMLIAATSLAILTPVLVTLGNLSWGEIAKGLITIAGAFAIIGIAGLILQPLVPAILGLAGAFTLIGIGVVAIGVGLTAAGVGLSLLAIGITALASALTAGATAIVAGLTVIVIGIAELIPAVAIKLAEGIIAFCEVIAKGAPAIGAALKALVLTTIDVLVECVPALASGLLKILDEVWAALAEHAPSIVDSAMKFLIGIVNAIGDRLPELIQAGVNLIMKFFGGIIDAIAGIDTGTLIKGLLGVGLLAGIMLALNAVAGLIPGAMAGVLGMGLVIAELALVLAAIGLFAQIPGLNWLIKEGGELLKNIGNALGSFIGGLLGGIAGGGMDTLPKLGECLSEFMTNAQDFIDGCRDIDESVLTGAGILAGAIAAIGVADIITSFADLLSFGPSLPKLGSDLSSFMNNASDFIDGASQLDPSTMEGVKTLAESIIILTGANLLDGLSKFFSLGESSLATFGEQLPLLGAGISGFANNLGDFSGKGELVTQAAGAIKTLAQVSSEIPNTGGLLAAIVGDNDLGTWASQLPNVGKGISGFISNLGEFDAGKVEVAKSAAEVIKVLAQSSTQIPNVGGCLAAIVGDNDLSTWAAQLPNVGKGISGFLSNIGEFNDGKIDIAKAAVDVIKVLAKASSEIPNTGGWLAAIVGDNDLSTWAEQLPNVGTGISGFVSNLGEFTDSNVATAKCAAEVIKILAQASQSIDGQAGWAKKIFGDDSISTFSDQFGDLGTNIAAFVENLGTFSEDQVKTTQQAIAAVRAFATLADSDISGAKKNIEGFGEKLPDFGTNISDFCENMPAADTIKSAVSNLKTIVGAIEDIGKTDTSTFKTFVESLGDAGTDGVKAFVTAFTSDTAKTDVKDAAKKLVDQAIDGVESKEKSVKTAFEDIVKSGVSAVKSKTNFNKFEGAGKYLVQGFASGITKNTYLAEAKAKAMANKAEAAAREALDINSPSKVFTAIGSSIPEGFANGIGMLGGLISRATNGMGQKAIDGVNRAISNIASVIDTDIDSEPTIRPVLDLSDVEYGVSAMNGMFTNQSVGVLANINGISTMMNGRRQNGTNTDIISAIDKFRDDFKHSDRTTYQINGITYDDGSNLRDAIETIIRYANIERRV